MHQQGVFPSHHPFDGLILNVGRDENVKSLADRLPTNTDFRSFAKAGLTFSEGTLLWLWKNVNKCEQIEKT